MCDSFQGRTNPGAMPCACPEHVSPLASLPYDARTAELWAGIVERLDDALANGKWEALSNALDIMDTMLRIQGMVFSTEETLKLVGRLWAFVTTTPAPITVLTRVAGALSQFMCCTKRFLCPHARAIVNLASVLPLLEPLLFPKASEHRAVQATEDAFRAALIGLVRVARKWASPTSDTDVINAAGLADGDLSTADYDARARAVSLVALLHSGRTRLPAVLQSPDLHLRSRRMESMILALDARALKHGCLEVSCLDITRRLEAHMRDLRMPLSRTQGSAREERPAHLPMLQASRSNAGLSAARDACHNAPDALGRFLAAAFVRRPEQTVQALSAWFGVHKALFSPSNSGPWADSIAQMIASLCKSVAIAARRNDLAAFTPCEKCRASDCPPAAEESQRALCGVLWPVIALLVHSHSPYAVVAIVLAVRHLSLLGGALAPGSAGSLNGISQNVKASLVDAALSIAEAGLLPGTEAHRVLAALGLAAAVCRSAILDSADRLAAILSMAIDHVDVADAYACLYAMMLFTNTAHIGAGSTSLWLSVVERSLAFVRSLPGASSDDLGAMDSATFSTLTNLWDAAFLRLSSDASAHAQAISMVRDALTNSEPMHPALALALGRSCRGSNDRLALDALLKALADVASSNVARAPAPSSGCVRSTPYEETRGLQVALAAMAGLVRHCPIVENDLRHSELLRSFVTEVVPRLRQRACVAYGGCIIKAFVRSVCDTYPLRLYGMADKVHMQWHVACTGELAQLALCAVAATLSATMADSSAHSDAAAAVELSRFALDALAIARMSVEKPAVNKASELSMAQQMLFDKLTAVAMDEKMQAMVRQAAVENLNRSARYTICGNTGRLAATADAHVQSWGLYAHERNVPVFEFARQCLAAHRLSQEARARACQMLVTLGCGCPLPPPVDRSRLLQLSLGPYAALRRPAQRALLHDLVVGGSGGIMSLVGSFLVPIICGSSAVDDCSRMSAAHSVDPKPDDVDVAHSSSSKGPSADEAKGALHMLCDHRVLFVLGSMDLSLGTLPILGHLLRSPLRTMHPGAAEGVTDALSGAASAIVRISHASSQGLSVESGKLLSAANSLSDAVAALGWRAESTFLQFAAVLVDAGAGSAIAGRVCHSLASEVADVRSHAVYRAISCIHHAPAPLVEQTLHAFIPWAMLEGTAHAPGFRPELAAVFRAFAASIGAIEVIARATEHHKLASPGTAMVYAQRGMLEVIIGSLLAVKPRGCAAALDALRDLLATTVYPTDGTRPFFDAGRYFGAVLGEDRSSEGVELAHLVNGVLLTTKTQTSAQRTHVLGLVHGVSSTLRLACAVSDEDLCAVSDTVRREAVALLATSGPAAVHAWLEPRLLVGCALSKELAHTVLHVLRRCAQDCVHLRIATWFPTLAGRVAELSRHGEMDIQLGAKVVAMHLASEVALDLVSDAPSLCQAISALALSACGGDKTGLATASGVLAADMALRVYSNHASSAVVLGLDVAVGCIALCVVANASVDVETRTAFARLLSAVCSSDNALAARLSSLTCRLLDTMHGADCSVSLFSAFPSEEGGPLSRGESRGRDLGTLALVSGALTVARPYDVPPWLPPLLARTPAILHAPACVLRGSPWVPGHVRRVVADFRRTHADTWHAADRAMFSEAELDAVSELLVSPSYYA